MAVSMQKKITDAIAKRLTDADLEVSSSYSYANCGTLYGQIGFDSVVVAAFQFNHGSCSVHINGAHVPALGLSDNPPLYRYVEDIVSFHALDYTDGERINAMLDLVSKAA
jgi:hypothetical protein